MSSFAQGVKADKKRVMPHSFFILYRLFLRVDNVLFRIYDVRIYHKFGSGEVIRESLGMEADYETIKSVSPS
jgi:type 2A phosphatase activator TIP41